MKRLLSLLLAAAIAFPLGAQKKPAEPEQQKLVVNIDVRVINVDVVVTDKRGNPVTGLKAEDFEIFENSAPKPVSNFYEVENGRPKLEAFETGAAAPEPEKTEIPDNMKRRIIFYVDNLSLAPFNRNRV
ncbi:MAG TPA: hypothetical protein VF608_02020, partial [Thermoanaerobaculia bacterium]